MLDNINSGSDYAKLLIDSIIENELTLPEEYRTDSGLIKFWAAQIEEAAEQSFNDYMEGKRETYMLDADEFEKLYDNARNEYVQDVLNGLVDKDMVTVSVNENGELLYGITDKGKQELGNGSSAE